MNDDRNDQPETNTAQPANGSNGDIIKDPNCVHESGEPGKVSDLLKKLGSNVAKTIMDPGVLKTLIDPEAYQSLVSRIVSERHTRSKAEWQKRSAPGELKTCIPIERYNMATSCSSAWIRLSGTETVRFCNQCRLNVYNFSDMELPEAEELIYQKEGLRQPLLWRRQDGKFLIRDCPVGIANKRKKLAAICLGIACVAGSAFYLHSLPSHKPAPPKESAASSSPSKSVQIWSPSPSEQQTTQPVASPQNITVSSSAEANKQASDDASNQAHKAKPQYIKAPKIPIQLPNGQWVMPDESSN